MKTFLYNAALAIVVLLILTVSILSIFDTTTILARSVSTIFFAIIIATIIGVSKLAYIEHKDKMTPDD